MKDIIDKIVKFYTDNYKLLNYKVEQEDVTPKVQYTFDNQMIVVPREIVSTLTLDIRINDGEMFTITVHLSTQQISKVHTELYPDTQSEITREIFFDNKELKFFDGLGFDFTFDYNLMFPDKSIESWFDI